jgi:hypothetical protein
MASAHAGPDLPRGARIILKDYCEGRLIYSHPPPGGWGKWCPAVVDPLEALDASAVLEGADPPLPSSLLPSPPLSSAPSKSGRITFSDNVLLPKAANRHNAALDPAPRLPSHSTEQRSEEERGEEDEEEMDDELDEETLRAFSRKVVLPAQVEEEEEDNEGTEDDNEEESGEEGRGEEGRGEMPSAAADAAVHGKTRSTASSATGARYPKKQRGLMKDRRRRKGEGREEDPYGTSAAADAASRPYHLAEVASVTSGPIGSAAGYASIANVMQGGLAKTEGRTSTGLLNRGKGKGEGQSKAVSTEQGVAFVDAVPRGLRGQAVKLTK